MADQSSTLETLAGELGCALYSLEGSLAPLNTAVLFAQLGLDVACELGADAAFAQSMDRASQHAAALAPAVVQLLNAREQQGDAGTAAALGQILACVAQLAASLNEVAQNFRRATAAMPQAAQLQSFGAELVERMLGDALAGYLDSSHPLLSRLLSCLAIIETTTAEVTVAGEPQIVLRNRLRLDRVGQWLNDPAAVCREAYGWGEATFNGTALLDRLCSLLDPLTPLSAIDAADVDRPAQVRMGSFRVAVARDATPPGLEGSWSAEVLAPGEVVLARLGENGRVALQISGQVAADMGLRLLPSAQLGALAGADMAGSMALAAVAEPADPAGRVVVFSVNKACRLEARSVSARLVAEVAVSAATQKSHCELRFEARLGAGLLVVESSALDGFLGSLLPSDGLRVPIDTTMTLRAGRPLSFSGSAGLDVSLPVNVSLGPVSVPAVQLQLKADAAALSVQAGATLKVALGPVQAVIDGVGLTAKLGLPRSGGNLGPIDVALGFKGPSGVGLSLDVHGVVSGGGFLYHDEVQGLYAGAMQLTLHGQLTLKAYGLIATRLPDGSRGYSMLVFITAEDFRPVPLGLGFTLLGIGGMVGVNRTFDEEVLRQGMKNGTLGALLFPRDPVGNASTLMRDLGRAFPARPGSYLMGLLAKIGWFTPTLVLLELALIVEFGQRSRLLALGRISALLPSAENDLVRLKMETIGVIDFDAGTAALDAELVDSRLAHRFPITGSAALRAGFGKGQPGFVLSVGGLNPHFAPPLGLPVLKRVAIALSSGDNPRLVCEAYFAITSNTVQFGAKASLYASAAGFSVQGDVGFDVLVQLVPLHFLAEFQARLQLKRHSHNLFMVKLQGQLEGPRPLRVSGKASFEILWCDFSVHFDATLVHGEPPPRPRAVDVLAQLTQALQAATSWSTQRPQAQSQAQAQTHGVVLRSLAPPAAGAPLVLDPLGQLVVKQQVVPLNTQRDIDSFGGAPVANDRRFTVTATLGEAGLALASTALQESFAPAQFFDMSDDERLAAPSFESMDAGCVLGSAAVVIDASQVVAAPLKYRTVLIGATAAVATVATPSTTTAAPDYTPNREQLQSASRNGAAARATLRRTGRARFMNEAIEPAATPQAKRWVIVPTGDGPPATLEPGLRTWSEYSAALRSLNRGGARWQLVSTHELQS